MQSSKPASPQAGHCCQREEKEASSDPSRLDGDGRSDRRDGPSSNGVGVEVLAWTAYVGAQTESSVSEPAHPWSQGDSSEMPKTRDSIETDREMWRAPHWNKRKPHRVSSMHKREDGVSQSWRQNRRCRGRRALSAEDGLNDCSHRLSRSHDIEKGASTERAGEANPLEHSCPSQEKVAQNAFCEPNPF
jgi:hypothetical protein